jgi:cytochrome P450
MTTQQRNTDIDDERPTVLDAEAADKSIEHLSMHDREVQRHRLAIYDRMREACPVGHSVEHGGFYALSTYRDVYDAAHLPAEFSSFPVTIPPFGNPVPMIPIESDPPGHANYRALVGQRFSPKRVAAMDDEIRSLVTELLDDLEGKREADLAKDIAVQLPLRVIFGMFLGVPRRDWDKMYDLAVAMLQPDPDDSDEQKHEKAGAAGMELMTYFTELLTELRKNGHGDDLVSELDQAHVEDVKLTDEEILGFCLLLVAAGFDTTASGISRMLQLFATNPEIRQAIKERVDDSQALDIAIEELVRYISPVPGLARTVNEPCEFAGRKLSKEDRLLLLWPSANRDADEFDNPNDFVADRKPNRHVGFGSGIHRCLGAHVARKEIKVLLQEMFRRDIPAYRLNPERPPVWHTGDTWGVKSLPVIFESWS